MISPAPVRPALLSVVVSRGHSRNPEKRALEAALVQAAEALPGVRVLDLPHLYDLQGDAEAVAAIRQAEGDLIVASWLFPRATHWMLDRLGVRGQVGQTALDEPAEEAEEASEASQDDASQDEGPPVAEQEPRVIDLFPRPERTIYCLDLRAGEAPLLVGELQRLAQQVTQRAASEAAASQQQAAEQQAAEREAAEREAAEREAVSGGAARFEAATTRRWYPVIDYSRCTNCMECIDFCLFGVYGIDGAETILVEQPDNCRKGCPACSRICPAGAIIFPQHKAPAIAGAVVEGDEGFKIDLSLLFGAPEATADPLAVAARERDEQLLLAGRAAAGMPRLRRPAAPSPAPPDQLDDLIDQLDRCEL